MSDTRLGRFQFDVQSPANFSDLTRKVMFYGYSYRWLQPRDDMTVEHLMDQSDPIRRQLLGASPSGGFGYTSPRDQDVPLKIWLEENLIETKHPPEARTR